MHLNSNMYAKSWLFLSFKLNRLITEEKKQLKDKKKVLGQLTLILVEKKLQKATRIFPLYLQVQVLQKK